MSERSGKDLLLSLPRFTDQGAAAYRPGLERMRALLQAMGDPHLAFRSVHVAGTNGKGSTVAMLASIGRALGYRTGLHTSPHLVDVTERMRVDGEPARKEWLERSVTKYRADLETIGPSFFEATVALSFLYFAEVSVDFAIVEVGMGGRLDATNVLLPEACAVTHVGLDHTEFLGETLPEIAREKAGIAKPDRPLVLYPAPPDVAEAVRFVCQERGAMLHESANEVLLHRTSIERGGTTFEARTPRASYGPIPLALPGDHQVENARVALRTAELVWGTLPTFDTAVREGFATVIEKSGIRGRSEVIAREPLLVTDVAHNPDGLLRALRTAETLAPSPDSRLHVLFAVMADKDIAGLARLLSSSADSVYCVAVESARALPAQVTSQWLSDAGATVDGHGSLEEGLAHAGSIARTEDVILVTGSHLLVGALLALLESRPAFGTAFV